MKKELRKYTRKIIKKNKKINDILIPIYRELKYFYRNIKFFSKEIFNSPSLPSLSKIYWINPKKIKFHTNFIPIRSLKIEDRVFDMVRHRGKVMGGNWDLTSNKFDDLLVFTSFKQRIKEKKEWSSTPYYNELLHDIKNGRSRFSCNNETELIKRFINIDSIIKDISQNGYKLNSNLYLNKGKIEKDEITVNIGRNGDYLFQNGRHRLSIAKLLEIDKIPIQILVRHKKWFEFRKRILRLANDLGGKLYQPAWHPDLLDIPFTHECIDRFEAIENSLPINRGKLLDVGANLFFFCNKFEEIGFNCIGIEKDFEHVNIAKLLKKASRKKFIIEYGNILDVKIINKIGYTFDVLLLLNICHHFLKEKKSFEKMTRWLRSIKTKYIFFEPHLQNEEQMKNAYLNFSNNEFVKYIMENTKKCKSIPIYKAKDGRPLFFIK
jgi:2-polyprenyl-3-methyl-5-hydroxy-6-metoxy-1,4-benzoquinol methylase